MSTTPDNTTPERVALSEAVRSLLTALSLASRDELGDTVRHLEAVSSDLSQRPDYRTDIKTVLPVLRARLKSY